MPTASDRASAEAAIWGRIISWSPGTVPDLYEDVPPAEASVVRCYDPGDDLAARAAAWDFEPARPHLDELARFAAALATAEAAAWRDDVPDRALAAYEARRHLVGDRIVHWAVPWLDAVARSYPSHRESALSDRDILLALGDELAIARVLTGAEGLTLPGEDVFGPLNPALSPEDLVGSLWSGSVLLAPELAQVQNDLATHYTAAAQRWRVVADRHPGTARLWLDLAERADRTAESLRGRVGTP